jgi:hypothetical protein
MKAYSIDDSGYFIGEIICDQSPLEPGVFLIPRNAITEAPPVFKDKEVPKWDGKKWTVEKKWRGEKLFNKETKIEWICDTFTPDLAIYTELEPTIENKNQRIVWQNNKWITLPDYSDITFFNKETRETKKYEVGENPDFQKYTLEKPIIDEFFQKWSESENKWTEDIELKKRNELAIRQANIQLLLDKSDYIELPSFIQRKGQSVYDSWMSYRTKLRLAYHDQTLSIPEKPEE